MNNQKLQAGDNAPDFEFQTPWSPIQNMYEISGENPIVLVFLRYQGCPVCQMEMAFLKREIELFKQKDANVIVLLQSQTETVAAVTNSEDWPFLIACDPQGDIFRKYAVEPGGILKYLHPAGMISAIKSFGQGFRHGKFEGKETQLPAVFSINAEKVITYAYYGRHISDVPLPETIAANIE